MEQQAENLKTAGAWLEQADGILITAGAGMGVDSGLPDFRGDNGFWRNYPGLRARNLDFYRIANGNLFLEEPELVWGFYGHRLDLYRRTVPHEGFQILRRWSESAQHGAFVFTSNVDGQFQKAGFAEDRIQECHGSIHFLQCAKSCSGDIWPADAVEPVVDESRCLLTSPVPRCPRCGGVARPNILMFNDYAWLDERTERQGDRLAAWKATVRNLVVVELGAGKAVPTVRNMSQRHGPRVIRINTRDAAIDPRAGIGLSGGALEVLRALTPSSASSSAACR